MGSTAIIAAIDKELAKLQQVRTGLIEKAKKQSGRSGPGKKKAKRELSPAGRARIAAAQRKRWAAARREKKR